MNKKLLRSVREYKKQSVLAPILVILEVLMEVLIPLEMAKIIDVGIANGDMSYIIQRGVILVAMAMLSLFFGVQAGNMAAVAAAGYAKNLRHDIFYKVQDFSFKNIDLDIFDDFLEVQREFFTECAANIHKEPLPNGEASCFRMRDCVELAKRHYQQKG